MPKRTTIIVGLAVIALIAVAVYLLMLRDTRPAVTATPSPAAPPAPALDEWQQAASAIRHVPIDSFSQVPDLVRFAFATYQCNVPQPHDASEPANLISGNFAAPDQTDWAALCTRRDSSYLMIVWGGPARCPTPAAAAAHADFLQGVGQGKIGYSRRIGVAGMQYILAQAREYGGPRPPSTNHDGIEDAFVGKASGILYCYAGQWVGLQGAD